MTVVLGITGGFSTGKTEVGKILEKKGFPVMDLMDEIFNILAQDKEIVRTISQYKDGKYQKLLKARNYWQLIQKLLDNIDDSQYFRILLKTQIKAILQNFISRNQGERLCAIISRNIFEDKLFTLCDYVITVSCDPQISKQRFIDSFESDSYTYVKVSNALIPNKTKEILADFIIYNTSSLVHLEKLMLNVVQLVI